MVLASPVADATPDGPVTTVAVERRLAGLVGVTVVGLAVASVALESTAALRSGLTRQDVSSSPTRSVFPVFGKIEKSGSEKGLPPVDESVVVGRAVAEVVVTSGHGARWVTDVGRPLLRDLVGDLPKCVLHLCLKGRRLPFM